MAKKIQQKPEINEKAYVGDLVKSIVDACPRRQPTSEDEYKAQMMMKEEFENIGLKCEVMPFKYNDNLYANMALHFGLGWLGTAVSPYAPHLGFALHSLCAGSYWAESTRKAYILRRIFTWKQSQNVLAYYPAETGEPDLRIVFLAHADAAFTGLIFNPKTVKMFSGDLPPQLSFLKRSMALAVQTQAALAVIDVLRMMFGPLTLPLRPLEWTLNVPAAITTILNLQMVLQNEIVPGANDDLSGVAAMPVLARRLMSDKPKNVEYVFTVTGCEEASLGGGDAMAVGKDGVWDKKKTVFIALDGLTNGELRILNPEGEVAETPVPEWLIDAAKSVSRSEKRFNGVTEFQPPVGGSDMAALLARGWQGLCLACVDPVLGAPLHYHQPSDTPENLDLDGIMLSIDYAEKLAREIISRRLCH